MIPPVPPKAEKIGSFGFIIAAKNNVSDNYTCTRAVHYTLTFARHRISSPKCYKGIKFIFSNLMDPRLKSYMNSKSNFITFEVATLK